jgi:hypothetical protein
VDEPLFSQARDIPLWGFLRHSEFSQQHSLRETAPCLNLVNSPLLPLIQGLGTGSFGGTA